MKKLKKIQCIICVLAILVQSFFFVNILTYAEETEEIKSIDLRIYQDHPGVVGYDVEYLFSIYAETEYDTTRITIDNVNLYCNNKNIKIDGNKVTVPAKFKDNTDIQGVKIYAELKSNPEIKTFYPLMIKNWTKTLEDNFDGDSLDTNVWSITKPFNLSNVSSKDGVTRTVASGVEDTVSVKDGKLVLKYLKNTAGKEVLTKDGKWITPDYSGGAIDSSGKFSQRYGLFVTSMKVPGEGSGGVNPAFWLLPTSGNWGKAFFAQQRSGSNVNQYLGEIDIIEYSAQWLPTQYQATDHWFTGIETGHVDNQVRVKSPLLWKDYNNFASVWTPNSVYYYYNGELVKQVKNLTPIDEEQAYILYSMGSSGYGGPDAATWTGWFTDDLLDTMVAYVDYVKVYK